MKRLIQFFLDIPKLLLGLFIKDSPPRQRYVFQTFILESILTPSGLLDSPGDDTPDFGGITDLPDFDETQDTEVDPSSEDILNTTSVLSDDFQNIGFLNDTPTFETGVFTVGESGQVSINFLYDGGGYKGQVAIFSLEGLDPSSSDFIEIAAQRALSNSELGHIVIDDASEGAKFSGRTDWEGNFNRGEYINPSLKTFEMKAGDTFAIMLVPNGTVEQVAENPSIGGSVRPLFSLATANPDDGFHVGQIADVTGDGSTFVMEDMRVDGSSDRDYNDIVFQVRGATGEAVDLDTVIDPDRDWRDSEMGREIYRDLDVGDNPDPVTPDPDPDFPVLIDPQTGSEYVPGQLLVKINPKVTDSDLGTIFETIGVNRSENMSLNPNNPSLWQVWHFDEDADLLQIQQDLIGNGIIEATELNYVMSIETADPNYGSLWGLNNHGQTGGTPDADIDAPQAWRYEMGDRNVTVAVIDTGIDYNHQDLAVNMWRNPGEIAGDGIDNDRNGLKDDIYGYDFINNDSDPMDDHYHGTHVAGTIGAVANNNTGVVGVSPNVSLMGLKVFDAAGRTSMTQIIRSVNYAADMGADVINASFGGGGYSRAFESAIARANDAGAVFVAAAGNNGRNTDFAAYYPSNYNLPNVISVAATDDNDDLASFSNYGQRTVDLGAPGENILSTLPGNRYGSASGTSMAAPHVAGAAALALAANPNATPAEVKARILGAVDPVTSLRGKAVTGGRLNIGNLFPHFKDSTLGRTVDFNGDGKTDFLRQEKGGWDDDYFRTAEVFLSHGNGQFSKTTLPEYFELSGDRDGGTNLHFGDFNGDGKTDILRQEKGGWSHDSIRTADILFSQGNGQFNLVTLPESFDLKGDHGTNLHIGDFNGDGKTDFLRQEKNGWDDDYFRTAEVFLSHGNGQFSKTTLPEYFELSGDRKGGVNIHLGDFNGDGKTDILRQEKGGWSHDSIRTADILFSQGNGQFNLVTLPENFDLKGDHGTNLHIGDFNGDGKTDFLRQEKNGWDDDYIQTAEVFLSLGNGGFNKVNLPESFDLKGDDGTYLYTSNARPWESNVHVPPTPPPTPPKPPTPVAPPALKATPGYLSQLQSGQLDGRKIEADGAFLYQCVDLTKYVTETSRITTYSWRRGANVMQNKAVAVGSAIAIFNAAGVYNHLHTAIFAGYDTVNGVSGFWVWSQNFPLRSGVRKHFIPSNGSSQYNNNAHDYHVILPL